MGFNVPSMGVKYVSVLRIWRFRKFCFQFKQLNAVGFRELHLILTGFIDMVKTVAWVSLIQAIILLAFAIISTNAMGQSEGVKNHWASTNTEWTLEDYFGTV